MLNKTQFNNRIIIFDDYRDFISSRELPVIKELQSLEMHSTKRLSDSLVAGIWQNHKIGDAYTMDGKPESWKIAYYPIFEDGKTGEQYEEPRALGEKPIVGGTDFREVPLRYLSKKK